MLTDDAQRTTPIDAVVIALTETSYYAIQAEDAPYIKAIRGVYVFDRNEHVHLCELTPSHRCAHVYDEVQFSDAEMDEETRDRIIQRYELHGESEDKYIHVRDLERIVAAGDRWNVHVYGATGASYEDESHDEQMDKLREQFCGNHPF